MPLIPGTSYDYRGVSDGDSEKNPVIVTDTTRVINGVICTAVLDRVYLNGELAEKSQILLATELPDGLIVMGSEGLIETAVEAVMDNAIGFCPAGGRVEIHLHRKDSRAVIAVANNGPYIPSEFSQQIFERGFSRYA